MTTHPDATETPEQRATFAVQFHSEDNGNCRVYYRDGRNLYCWQLDDGRRNTFKFYRCSRDGEPSHGVTAPDATPRAPAETAIGRELNAFLDTDRRA
jgi:hypothetical protein